MTPTTIAGIATPKNMKRQPSRPKTTSSCWISQPASGAPMTVVSGWAK